jgi:hypothetical protein
MLSSAMKSWFGRAPAMKPVVTASEAKPVAATPEAQGLPLCPRAGLHRLPRRRRRRPGRPPAWR